MRCGIPAKRTDRWGSSQRAGWEDQCRTLEQKDYEEKQGIRFEQVAKNPGRKQVAKVMLNR